METELATSESQGLNWFKATHKRDIWYLQKACIFHVKNRRGAGKNKSVLMKCKHNFQLSMASTYLKKACVNCLTKEKKLVRFIQSFQERKELNYKRELVWGLKRNPPLKDNHPLTWKKNQKSCVILILMTLFLYLPSNLREGNCLTTFKCPASTSNILRCRQTSQPCGVHIRCLVSIPWGIQSPGLDGWVHSWHCSPTHLMWMPAGELIYASHTEQ